MKTTILLTTDCTPETIKEEEHFSHLNATGFVRGRTAQDQWYLLLNEAWNASRLPENQVVKDYLSVMLHRFMGRSDLFAQLRAFDYCRHVLGVRNVDAPCMQDVADMALQYVAFFPEASTYRHEQRSLTYSAEIGVSLYTELAHASSKKDDWFSKAFVAMATCFGQAVIVLRSVCPRFIERRHVRTAVRENATRFLSNREATDVLTHIRNFDLLFCEEPHNTVRRVQ